MKHFFIALIAIFCISFANAQGQSGTLEYNGAKYPSESFVYNVPANDMTTIIQDKMKAAGYTAEKSKGFLVYRNVKMNEFGGENSHDIIFKVEQKSRKEKGSSIVNMITALPGEIPAEKVKDGGKSLANITPAPGAGEFFGSLQPAVVQQAHNLSVLAKQKEVDNAQKKLTKLQKEQSSLEKKIKDLQDKLSTNAKEQQAQTAELQSLKSALEVIKNNQPQQ